MEKFKKIVFGQKKNRKEMKTKKLVRWLEGNEHVKNES